MRTISTIHIIFVSILMFFTIMAQAQTNAYSVKTVVIDAGHGGKDPGACGKFSQEKNIALSVALKAGGLISMNCPDVKVIYTRKTDEFIELHKRAEIANKAKADLFISIHVNANTNPNSNGTETYTMGVAKNEANLRVAKAENDVISLESDASQYQGMSANDNEAIILHNLQQGAFCDNSLAFAGMIQNRYKEDVGRKDRSVQQAGFLVLWKTAMPSVLTEIGFITNEEEEKWLNNSDNQAELAYAIYRAFVDYKKYIEKRSNGEITHNPQTEQNVAPSPKPAPAPSPAKPTVNNNNKPAPKPTPAPASKTESYIYYSIQIGAGKDKIATTPENFNGLSNVFYIEEDGLFKYYCGKTSTYKEITLLLPEVKSKYPSAYVVARDNTNKKLQLTEARQKTK